MASRINSILVFLLLLFLPTQLGKHFFMDFSFINGVRIDYLAPTFYLVDILALLLIAFNWKVIWRKIVKLLNCYIATSLNCLIGLLLLVGINVIGAKEPMMGLYVVGRLVEMYALFVVFSGRSRNEFGMTKGSFGMTVLVPLFIGSVVELFLSLSQLITQHSLQGIFYFLGERAFSVSTPGIATISMFGNQVLRAYGTFSHPNSMGGFYLLLYVFVLFTPRFFSLDFARDQNDKEVGSRNKFGMTTLLRFGILVISSCLILISFSKVAIVCFVLVNAYSSLKELKLDCRFCKFARVFILGVVSLIFLSGQSDILSWDKRVLLIKQSFIWCRSGKFPILPIGAFEQASVLIYTTSPQYFPSFCNRSWNSYYRSNRLSDVEIPKQVRDD